MNESRTLTIEERASDFADNRIAPYVADWPVDWAIRDHLYREAGEAGFLGIEIPLELGGQGHSFSAKVKVFETITTADFGFAMSLVNTHNVAARLVASAPENLRDQYLQKLLQGEISACTALTEPSTGTDLAAMQTRATKTENGWVISGEKTWIVNGRNASLAIVFAHCEGRTASMGIGAFLVDLEDPNVSRCPIDTEFSQASMGTGGFVFDNVLLSDAHLLLPPDTAFKKILNEINGARIYVAAMCRGMLQQAIEEVQSYGEKRFSFGKPLIEIPSWIRVLEEARDSISTLSALIDEAVLDFENLRDCQFIAAQSKVEAVETCQHHLPKLLHAMGAEGLKPAYCFSRHIAAVQLAGFTDGATSMLKDRLVKLTEKRNNISNPKET